MKSVILPLTAIWIVLVASCSHKDQSITLIEQKGETLMIMNLKNITDSIKINLSDIATDLRFIQLETRPDCLISNATYYITDKYVLARTKSGIYQFDHLGKFIRVLVSRGQGPREYETAEWVIDEKNQRLILADEQKTGYLLYFDLKTGEYLGDIPKAIPGVTRKFAITAYGSLACVPYVTPGGATDTYYLFWQDIQGKLIDAIKGPPDLAIWHDNYLEPIPEGYRYMLAHSNKDTIYTIRDKSLIPFLAFNYGEEVPDNMETPGYRSMKIVLETDQYLILSKLQLSEVLTSGDRTSTSWTGSEYLLDKQQQKAYLIPGIYNDFIGAALPAQMYRKLPNNKIYNILQAFELIGMAERAIDNPKSDQKLIGRMSDIRDQVSREDNPVLVVGALK
ncbi:MAG: 6-bladed beta-propeller [Bacteroidales bacterium]|jgi:hypothetical protein